MQQEGKNIILGLSGAKSSVGQVSKGALQSENQLRPLLPWEPAAKSLAG